MIVRYGIASRNGNYWIMRSSLGDRIELLHATLALHQTWAVVTFGKLSQAYCFRRRWTIANKSHRGTPLYIMEMTENNNTPMFI